MITVTTDQKAVKITRAIKNDTRSCHAQKPLRKSPPESQILIIGKFNPKNFKKCIFNTRTVTQHRVAGNTQTQVGCSKVISTFFLRFPLVSNYTN